MIVFGPIPSRRLGRSLGINNIPPKTCTYSCIYCQIGRTTRMQAHRRAFYKPEEILAAVEDKLEQAERAGESIDYITFVPDGEPTLDSNLGREIELLQPLGIKIAVITNASLIGQADVREDLMRADWVSLKVDAIRGDVWHRVNRPNRAIRLGPMFDGICEFAASYSGDLVTETMLVLNINDRDYHLMEIADFLAGLQPKIAYLTIPIRPPAEKWVRAPRENVINRAYQLIQNRVARAEYLIGDEDSTFVSTGEVAEDLLSIVAVHPMREEAVDTLLARTNADRSVVHKLIRQGQLVETIYEGRKFYMRKLSPDYQS